MHITTIIPARYGSTRFPGKPLALIDGIPMIQRVYRQVKKVKRLDEVIVATDDGRIAAAIGNIGGTAVLTRNDHPNGTSRCAEVAELLPGADWIINVQGDEPFIAPRQIEGLIDQLLSQKKGIATLAKKIDTQQEWLNPNVVKVLFDKNGKALYFSRAPLPHMTPLSPQQQAPDSHPISATAIYPPTLWNQQRFYKHIGLYGYDRQTLLDISQLPPSPLELAESLEQLRWLENGHPIGVAITDQESIAIDTPDDIKKAENWLKRL